MKTKLNLVASFLLFFSTYNAQTIMNETFTGASLPTGWSISSTATNPSEKWVFSADFDDVEVYESTTVNQNELLSLPALNLQPYSSMYFNFSLWMYNKTSFVKDKSCRTEVVISTNNGVTWNQVWDSYSLNLNEFGGQALFNKIWSVNLTSYCGSGKPPVKVAFRYTSNKGKSTPITSFSALIRVNISSNPITSLSNLDKQLMNWYPINNYAGTFEIYYGPLGTTTDKGGGKLVTGLTGSSFTFPENYCQYSAFIRTNTGVAGEWVKTDFSNAVDNIIANPSSNSSIIGWTGDSNSYDLEYGVGNFTVGSGTRISNIAGTIYNLNSLLSNTTYKVYIKASCNTASWSNITFKTLVLETSETKAPQLLISPNPTRDFLNFSQEVNDLMISDLSGKMMIPIENHVKKINISKLSTGNYIISGTFKGEKFTKKIIKN